ncbi:MAG: hypothetical protein K0Q72_4425, partial [Armatimonadetes bacterium]|nr:hypothetical protein [Armatimonadota bacterium]
GEARHSDGLKLEGGRLITLPGTTLSQIETQYLDRFNESPNKTEAVRSFYYLEELSGRNEAETEPRYAVRVNRSFFRLQSPYREIPAWEGLITASGQVEEPTFNVLGRRVSLSLKQDGDARTMTIDGRDSLREHSKLLILARTPGSPAMCELSRVGQDVELRSKQGDWKVQVNGREAGYERVADRLRPNDILALTDPNGRRLSLLYLGVKPSVLAFTQWRNGRKKRVFPEGGVFALADTMGKAADRTIQLQDEAKRRLHRVADEDRPFTEALVKAPTLPTDKSLALSLDLSLHRGLQEYTESWMGSRAMRGARIRPRRLAITLMDAFSGEVVAMPSWPAEDPGDPDRDRKLRELSPRQRALLTGNHNLVNHAIGSTVKPVLLATTATQFWPSGKDLGKLTIYGRTTEQTHLGGLELQKSYSPPEGIRTAEMGPFLSQSYDWPACMLGILGMLTRPEDLSTAWVPATSNYDIRYQGKGYKVDMWKPEATPFIGQDRRAPRVGVQYADQGLLFTGLEKLFDATRSPTEKELTALELQRLQQFYPTLAPYTALNEQVDQNDYLDDILPVPVVISPRDFQTIRGDLISLFIGGGNCRWNNVLMAQAAARLATGRRVTATFERRPGGEFPPMPDPLGKSAWRKEHLEQPMIRAGQVGTARSLRSAAGRGDVVVMFKTGTINEAKPDRDSETLMFIVGVQRNGEFVRGATVAGYLYMQDASSKDRGDMRKFDFARPVLREVGRYVREHAAAMKASGASTGAGAP